MIDHEYRKLLQEERRHIYDTSQTFRKFDEKIEREPMSEEDKEDAFERTAYKEPGFNDVPNCDNTTDMKWSEHEEVWKEVPNVHDDYRLFVSSYGKVRALLKIMKNKDGRIFINIGGTYYPLDVLVAAMFKPNPTLSEKVVHNDGNCVNNNPDNLEWLPNQQCLEPVISTYNVQRKVYQHSKLGGYLYALITKYIDRKIDPLIMSIIGYLSPILQKTMWDAANLVLNKNVIDAMRKHYPWLDRVNNDNISTYGVDSVDENGKHVITMGDDPYNMLYYALDDDSYNNAQNLKRRRIIENVIRNNEVQMMEAMMTPPLKKQRKDFLDAGNLLDVLLDENGVPLFPSEFVMERIKNMVGAKNKDVTILDNGNYNSGLSQTNKPVQKNKEQKSEPVKQKPKPLPMRQPTAGDMFGSVYTTVPKSKVVTPVITNTDTYNRLDIVPQKKEEKQVSALYPEIDKSGAMYKDEEHNDILSSDDYMEEILKNAEKLPDDQQPKKVSLLDLLRQMGFNVPDDFPEPDDTLSDSYWRNLLENKRRFDAALKQSFGHKNTKGDAAKTESTLFGGKDMLTPEEFDERETTLPDTLIPLTRDDSLALQNELAIDPLITQSQRLTNYQRQLVNKMLKQQRDEILNKLSHNASSIPGYATDENGNMILFQEVPHPELLAANFQRRKRGKQAAPIVVTFPNGKQRIFRTAMAAAEYTGADPKTIGRCCRGEVEYARGFLFRFVKIKDTNDVLMKYIADLDDNNKQSFYVPDDMEVPVYDDINQIKNTAFYVVEDKKKVKVKKKPGTRLKKHTLLPKYDENGNEIKRTKGRPKNSEYAEYQKAQQDYEEYAEKMEELLQMREDRKKWYDERIEAYRQKKSKEEELKFNEKVKQADEVRRQLIEEEKRNKVVKPEDMAEEDSISEY